MKENIVSKMIIILLFVLVCLTTPDTSHAWAGGVVDKNDTENNGYWTYTWRITPGNNEIIKDFHIYVGDVRSGKMRKIRRQVDVLSAPANWVDNITQPVNNGEVYINIYSGANGAALGGATDFKVKIRKDATIWDHNSEYMINCTSDGNDAPDNNLSAPSTEANGPQLVFFEIPTLTEWGLIIFALLGLTFGAVFIRRRHSVLAGVGVDDNQFVKRSGVAIFVLSLYIKILTMMLTITAIGFAILTWWFGSFSPVDICGTLTCVAIVAYLVHLCIVSKMDGR